MKHDDLVNEAEKIFLGELSTALLGRARRKANTQAIARRRKFGSNDQAAALRQNQADKFDRGARGLKPTGDEWKDGVRFKKGELDSYGKGEAGFDDPEKKFEPRSTNKYGGHKGEPVRSHHPDTKPQKWIKAQPSVVDNPDGKKGWRIPMDRPVGRHMSGQGRLRTVYDKE